MSGSPVIRVAQLAPCFTPEVNRGTERLIGELAAGLLERNVISRVITAHPGAPSRTAENGIEVIRNWRPPDRLLIKLGFQEYLSHTPFTYACLRRGDDDLAHAHYLTDAAAALRWARASGRPVIFSYHGMPRREVAAARRLRLRLLLAALHESDRVIVSSRAAADAMMRWFGVDAVPVYPTVRLAELEIDEPRSEHPVIICAAAPDDTRKRVPMLVRAFTAVKRTRPDAELHLVRPRDRELAARLQRTPGVSLFDPVAALRDLAPLYARAWVSALTAHDEAFGLVLAEALACGTPVVGTRDGGIPEIITDDGVGRTFERDDEGGLVSALQEALELASDPGVVARCRGAATRFRQPRMIESHLEIYGEALR